MKASVQLVLPLLGQTARADDETPLQVAPRDQFLHEEPGHDGLAGSWVVGQKKPERLARQHRLVHGRDLVRERLDERRVYREDRVEEVCQADAMRLGDEPKQSAVAVEAPRPTQLHHFYPLLVVTIQQLVGDLALWRLVGQLKGFRTEPCDAHDGNETVGQHAANRGRGLQVLKSSHVEIWPRSGIVCRESWFGRSLGRSVLPKSGKSASMSH